MDTGTVQGYDIDSGYGTILSDSNGQTYQVQMKHIAPMTVGPASFRSLRQGQRVVFNPVGDEARNVHVIGGV